MSNLNICMKILKNKQKMISRQFLPNQQYVWTWGIIVYSQYIPALFDYRWNTISIGFTFNFSRKCVSWLSVCLASLSFLFLRLRDSNNWVVKLCQSEFHSWVPKTLLSSKLKSSKHDLVWLQILTYIIAFFN